MGTDFRHMLENNYDKDKEKKRKEKKRKEKKRKEKKRRKISLSKHVWRHP
jgi:hypothetical protein